MVEEGPVDMVVEGEPEKKHKATAGLLGNMSGYLSL